MRLTDSIRGSSYVVFMWKSSLTGKFNVQCDFSILVLCRYDRELNGERSALKRVTERDSSAGHTMVLCVSAVRSVKDIEHFYEIWIENRDNAEGNKAKLPPAGVIEVTDGW